MPEHERVECPVCERMVMLTPAGNLRRHLMGPVGSDHCGAGGRPRGSVVVDDNGFIHLVSSVA